MTLERALWLTWAFIAVALVLLLLAGCSGISAERQSNAPGQAAYSLSKSADGSCKVWITSGRDVEAGRILIGPDCTVEADAQSLSGKELQMQMLEIIQRLAPISGN